MKKVIALVLALTMLCHGFRRDPGHGGLRRHHHLQLRFR